MAVFHGPAALQGPTVRYHFLKNCNIYVYKACAVCLPTLVKQSSACETVAIHYNKSFFKVVMDSNAVFRV